MYLFKPSEVTAVQKNDVETLMIFCTPLVFFVGSSLPMWKFILCLSSFKPETASENLVKSELQVFI